MAKFEVLEGHRPLEDVSWVKGVTEEADRIFGKGVMDFQDGNLAARGIVLLDANEQARLHRQGNLSGDMVTDNTEIFAEETVPASFHSPLTAEIRTRGPRVVSREGSRERELTVRMKGCLDILDPERQALTGSVGRSIGTTLNWQIARNAVGIVLATIDEDIYIDNKDLYKLGKSMPARVYAGEGELSRATVNTQDRAAA